MSRGKQQCSALHTFVANEQFQGSRSDFTILHMYLFKSFQNLQQSMCRYLRVEFRSEMNIYFYQLGLDKCPMITTLTKPELYLWI